MASDKSSSRDETKVVVIAASAGGVEAVAKLLSALPVAFPAPIVIVQHRRPANPSQLRQVLARFTRLPVVDAKERDRLKPGVVYVARPDRHLSISNAGRVHYSNGHHKIRHLLSSANPLFESSAEAFGPGVIGVVLTGTDGDGTDGVQAIKRCGGTVIAQNEATSQFFGMPASAIGTGAVDYVLPLEEIGPALCRLTRRHVHAHRGQAAANPPQTQEL